VPKTKTRIDSGRRAVAALVLWAVAGGKLAAQPAMLHWRCTNSASGASWTIAVDLAHRQVDRFPATITRRWISWHDPDRGFYDLDRATGALQLRNASSTGGYFMHYRCRAE
jgi:hypothetical protein